MASIDLCIIDRGIQGTEWTAQNTGIQASQLDKIKETRTDNSGALNSLPTPFARFFVVKEAFRRITEEKRHKDYYAGLAYTRLVSDCLDVFELLFNKKYHENQWGEKERIVIKEWDKNEQLNELKNNVPILYNAIVATYNEDIKEEKLFFVVLEKDGKEYLLATSSPMTGFVTPPDIDKYEVKENNTDSVKFRGEQYNNLFISRKNGKGAYFRDVLLFEDRDKDFKNYMYQLFGTGTLDERFQVIRDYILMFGNDTDIRNDYRLRTEHVFTEYNSQLLINGLNVSYNDEIDINSFFMPKLVRLPFKINKENYVGITYERDPNERDYDFLIPLRSEALAYLDQGLATCVCQIKPYSVVVKFKYNGNEYKKEYGQDDIYDLKDNAKYINIGLFPNILSLIESENNYFKVALSFADLNGKFGTPMDVKLTFFKKDTNGIFAEIHEVAKEKVGMAKNGVLPVVVRSEQRKDTDTDCTTKYYEIFNSGFDAVEFNVEGNEGFVLPKWKQAERSNDSYTYAIDLGTSNTFVSRKKDNEDNMPEMFSMNKPMVSYLHEYDENTQFSLVSNIEESMEDVCREIMKTEFVPPMIDGFDYKFPIRTAICKASNITGNAALFDNHNIAFFYEKMLEKTLQECITDIKWEQDEEPVRIFVQELMLIIKCDVLQRNGILTQTKIIWFRPLSFSGNTRRMYDKLWKELPKEFLFTDNVNCYTESEAPYYYFKKLAKVKNTDSVAIIDIGGGSTDYVYFSENKPLSATSVHFGCDVIWGNGHNEFGNARENGIYNKLVGNVDWGNNDYYRKLESEMKANLKCSTTDIINFWLGNSKYNDVLDRLHNDYLPLFVYHFTAILFHISHLYKYKGYAAPRTIVFSGNGSRYIDNFITDDPKVVEEIVTAIFSDVYGSIDRIHVLLPKKRKESTCYGGLYRSKSLEDIIPTYYQGVDKEYENVGDMNSDKSMKDMLMRRYESMNNLYGKILDILKRKDIIDNEVNIEQFKSVSSAGYDENFTTHYRSIVKEKYADSDIFSDSVFFIPVIDKIFELTKIV